MIRPGFGHKQPRRFLERVEDNILTQTVDELTRTAVLLTDKVDLDGVVNAEGSHCCNDNEMVEK